MHKQPTMKYSGYWPSIVETNLDHHMPHTFLSCNLSFPSLSPVTSLIMPTNDDPVLMDFTFGRSEQFQNYTCRRMFQNYHPHIQHYCVRLSIPMLR